MDVSDNRASDKDVLNGALYYAFVSIAEPGIGYPFFLGFGMNVGVKRGQDDYPYRMAVSNEVNSNQIYIDVGKVIRKRGILEMIWQ